MAMTKARKHQLKGEIAERLKKANAAIVAEYRGLTVAELTDLRVRLRESNSEFRVIKNRVTKVAIREEAENVGAISGSLKGPVGLVIIYGDPAQAAKSVLEFAKDKENFKVTSGVMDGKGVSAADLKAISELPTMDVLLARLVGTLVAPHRGLLGVLNGVPRQLVQVINAIKDKKAN
jgi:large subunit ribosomal protein L10